MGIANLNTFLRKHCPGVFKEIHISEYAYKKLAIDTSLFLCKFKAICGDRWLTAFVNLVSCLRRNEIHCVFIYDTGCVVEKEEERAERRRQQEKNKQRVAELDVAYEKYELTGEIESILSELYDKVKDKAQPSIQIKSFLRKKQTANTGIDMNVVKDKIEKMRSNILDISKDDFELTKKLFKILNIPFYDAPLEAETMCSDLCKRGLVDAVLSEDTDVLAYGSPIFLTKIDSGNDTCVQICIEEILEELEITYEQFLDLCIMFGCDYNKNIPKVGIETSFKYIKKYGSIDGIKENTKHDVTILNHERTRELFTKYPQYEITTIPFCGFPDFEKLKEFVTEHKINISLENLEKNFVHNTIMIIEEEENIFIIEE